jgi:hypothetical protein
LRCVGRPEHDRNALRDDLVRELDVHFRVALIVLDNEMHGPALDAAGLVNAALDRGEDLKLRL